jgi:uncharacterized protein (TIGR02145 family)
VEVQFTGIDFMIFDFLRVCKRRYVVVHLGVNYKCMKAALTVVGLLCVTWLFSQEEKLEVEGAIQIGDSEDPEPDAGTIRWTGTDFEGWDGTKWISLSKATSPCGGLTFVQDVEANRYPIVAIGDQCWMAENLKTTMYNDGTSIPHNPDNWNSDPVPAYCWYNNDPDSLGQIYGALCNHFAVSDMNTFNICPAGWHIPSFQEVTKMFEDFSYNADIFLEAGTVHWLQPNSASSNLTGFTALPGGTRLENSAFDGIGTTGAWWASNDGIVEGNGNRYIFQYRSTSTGSSPKSFGYSIRCIKDN